MNSLQQYYSILHRLQCACGSIVMCLNGPFLPLVQFPMHEVPLLKSFDWADSSSMLMCIYMHED